MAIDITITIPGDPGLPDTAAGRVKAAIDYLFDDNPDHPDRPQSPAEYRQVVANWLIRALKTEVKHIEKARRSAELAAIDLIDVQAS